METVLNIMSSLMAFFAAGFWFYSAKTTVPPNEEPDETGMIPFSIQVDGADFIASAKRQSHYSALAAIFAGIAATLQGFGVLIS